MKNKRNRQLHYKRKLRYELISGGIVFDYIEYRKALRLNKTLWGVKQRNEGWLYVNPLGVKSVRKPF